MTADEARLILNIGKQDGVEHMMKVRNPLATLLYIIDGFNS
jgi:hypothetical protein